MSDATMTVAVAASRASARRSVIVRRWQPLALAALIVACAGSAVLAVPTITRFSADPNLVVYFDSDEGGTMDLLWFYYSGEQRPSIQWDFDYGPELFYVAKAAHLLLAPWTHVTPLTLLYLVRWLHLIGWLGALAVLWRLVGRHIAAGWPQIVAVLAVAARPAFDHVITKSQPEPWVLCFMLLGLEATLRIIDEPRLRHVSGAAAWAALAFLTKYAGLFLVPAIVLAMLRAEGQRRTTALMTQPCFPRFSAAWSLYACLGLCVMGAALLAMLGYVRHATGTTWFAQHGFWGSLRANKALALCAMLGVGCVGVSALAWWRIRRHAIHSSLAIVAGCFLGWTGVFAAPWLLAPRLVLKAYSQLPSLVMTTSTVHRLPQRGVGQAWLEHLVSRLRAFDIWMVCLCALVVGVQCWAMHRRRETERQAVNKQLVLLGVLAPFALVMSSLWHVEQHHMLPFIAVTIVLILSALQTLRRAWSQSPRRYALVLACAAAVFAGDIAVNGDALITARVHQWRRGDDIALAFDAWRRANIPPGARVAADHYRRVYVPSDHSRFIALRGYEHPQRWASQMRALVESVRPAWVYYNTRPIDDTPLPPLEQVLPQWRVQLVQVFDSAGRRYQRMPGDRFVIYRVEAP